MARYTFYTLDVFTDRIFGGNPLAVIHNAVGLTTQQMQAVAATGGSSSEPLHPLFVFGEGIFFAVTGLSVVG